MSKNTRGGKEFSRLQEALHENKRLKREIASIRKQLARLDLDRHGYVKDILEEHYAAEEDQRDTGKALARLKEEWKCEKCPNGYLEINLYTRLNETMYFRKCNLCPHRTTSQKYEPDSVEGIMKIPLSK